MRAEIKLLDNKCYHKLVVMIQNYKAQAANQTEDQYLILGVAILEELGHKQWKGQSVMLSVLS